MRSSNAYCAVHQHKIYTMWPFNKTFAVLDHPGKESSKVVLNFHDWLSLSIMDKGRKKLPVIFTFLATVNNAAMNIGIQIYFWAPAFSSLKYIFRSRIAGSYEKSWRREWQPTPVFLPEKFHGQGAWWAPGGHQESDMTEMFMLFSTKAASFYIPKQ